MTNADAIRAMTDKELAYFIAKNRFCTVEAMADKMKLDIEDSFGECYKNVCAWLKKDADVPETHLNAL